MELAEKMKCPICECDTAHLNNHIRMSNGNGHGPTQQYPDGWDKSAEGFVDVDVDVNEGSDVAIDVDGSDVDEPDAEALVIEDRPSDMREYECTECEASIGYLDDECSEGHEQEWYA